LRALVTLLLMMRADGADHRNLRWRRGLPMPCFSPAGGFRAIAVQGSFSGSVSCPSL